MPFGPLYDIINNLARWGLNSFYSEIVTTNPHYVPANTPVIIASNHWNMTMDPAMLSTRMPYGRRLHYWAKNTLFKNPIVNYVLLDAGNIPVDRTTKNNQLLFRGTFDVLKLGECVALFPEGTSYTQPKIIQVKDGIAWTALEYAKNLRLTGSTLSGSSGTASGMTEAPGEVQDVQVIVCGLNYTNKTNYRSSAQLEYSPALVLDSSLIEKFMTPGEEKLAVKDFIKRIETRMREVTVNSEDWETLWCTWIIREIIWEDGLGPLHHYRDSMQQLVNVFSLKEDSSPGLKNLRAELLKYHNLLTTAQSTHLIFSRVFPTRECRGRLMYELARCMIRWPFFLVPAVFHLPVYLGAYVGSRLQPTELESMAQNKVVLGLFSGLAFVPIYVVVMARALLSQQANVNWVMRVVAMVISLGLVILIHVVHDVLVDTNYEAWKRLKMIWKVKGDELDELWDARDECNDGWRSFYCELKKSNHPIIYTIAERHGLLTGIDGSSGQMEDSSDYQADEKHALANKKDQ